MNKTISFQQVLSKMLPTPVILRRNAKMWSDRLRQFMEDWKSVAVSLLFHAAYFPFSPHKRLLNYFYTRVAYARPRAKTIEYCFSSKIGDSRFSCTLPEPKTGTVPGKAAISLNIHVAKFVNSFFALFVEKRRATGFDWQKHATAQFKNTES